VGTLQGIIIAIVLSLLSLLYQDERPTLHVLGRKPGTDVFRPSSKEHPEDETFPGILLLQPEGRIFFANAQNISERILTLIETDRPRVIVLDFSRVFDLEYTALKMLIEAEERQRSQGTMLCIAGLNPEMLNIVRRSSLGKTLGRKRMFFNVATAVRQYLKGSETAM
jgi:MFS superfamily sulfate permease-like transporter